MLIGQLSGQNLVTKLVGLALALVFFLALPVIEAQAYTVPPYQGFVNDFADVLPEGEETILESRLAIAAEATNGAELAIVTIPNLGGESIEGVAQQFFDTWKIGKAKFDNGVLLLVAMEDREVRIQTGYGAEIALPDGKAGRIIRNSIVPAFKSGDYVAGIMVGSDQILLAMSDPNAIPEDTSVESSDSGEGAVWIGVAVLYLAFTFGVTILTYAVAFIGRSKAWWPGGLVGLGLGWLVGNWPAGVALGLLGLWLDYILSKNYHHWSLEHKTTAWRDTWGGFIASSSSSSGSSSSSSHSFGGGSSGGGGASGSW